MVVSFTTLHRSMLQSRPLLIHTVKAIGVHPKHRHNALKSILPKAQEGEKPSNSDSDDIILIEQQIGKRKAKPKTPPPAPGSYKVISAARDQVYGDAPLTQVQQFENAYVSFLAFIFVVILGEGVFLAASGFLSEDIDQFAQDVVYPAFSPTVILFLVFSSLYGLWKTGGLGRDEENKQ